MFSRRSLSLSLAGIALAPPARAKPPPVLINLADTADAEVLKGGADAALRMTVPVTINDQGPFEFVVDTGANRSVLASEIAAPLHLPAGKPAAIHGIAGVEPAPTALVAKLSVGQVTARQVRAPLLPRARLGADGILGVDAMKNRRVRLDFRNNRLQIARSESGFGTETDTQTTRLGADKPDPSVVVVPARYRFGQLIIIDADIGGLPVTAFLDSGSQDTVGNLALRDAMVRTNPGLIERRTVVQLISATGQTAHGDLAAVPNFRIGGLRIGGMSAVFSDLHIFDLWGLKTQPAILIGIDVMRHFQSIDLDFGERRVTFRTAPRPASVAQ